MLVGKYNLTKRKCHTLVFSSQLCADQDPYDFIDPNPDEEATLSEGDLQHNVPYVSCLKVLYA